jgi:hypothetical protein
MIRDFEPRDLPKIKDLLAANDLPKECMPDLLVTDELGRKQKNPLFVVQRVFEVEGKTAMLCFLKIRSELYFFIDHTVGTPESRWEWLQEFTEDMRQQAWKLGLDQMTAFVPPDIDESFSKRLKDLGFVKSPWVPYSLNLE